MTNKEIIKHEIQKLINEKKIITTRIQSGGVLFNECETCEYLGYLLKGKLNISTLSFKDKEEIISTINEGEFFGQFLIFNESTSTYLGDVIAIKNSEIALINKNTLDNILMTNKVFLNAYLCDISIEAFRIKQQVKMLSHKKNIDRVIYYLENNNTNGVIDIKSITSLAKIVNLPRENVSRIISKLVKDGYITKIDSEIKIIK